MNKRKVIDQIIGYLQDEMQDLRGASSISARPEPEVQARIREIEQLLLMYRFLPVRELGSEDVVCPAALVELELNGGRAFYFVAPRGGGLVMRVEDAPVQVITPQSPIGEAILGKKTGDVVEVRLREAGVRRYRVVSVS